MHQNNNTAPQNRLTIACKSFPALLCLLFLSCTRSSNGYRLLTVGDTIPPIILTDVVNFPVAEIQSSVCKGKPPFKNACFPYGNAWVCSIPKLCSLQSNRCHTQKGIQCKTDCQLPIAHCQLLIASSHEPWTMNHEPSTINPSFFTP